MTNPFQEQQEKYIDPQTHSFSANELIEDFITYISSIDPELDLSSLKSIKYGNYQKILDSLSAELGRTITYTNRDSGEGVAQLVHIDDYDILVISEGLLLGLLHDQHTSMLCVNTLHHELCHAHDSSISRIVLGNDWLNPILSGWESHLMPISFNIWSEYSANRRSYPTLLNGECYQIEMLVNEIDKTQQTIKKGINQFHINNDITNFMNTLFTSIYWLFKLMGYSLGSLGGGNKEIYEYNADYSEIINKSHIREVWESLKEHLDFMYRTHTTWKGIEIFQPINNMISSFLKKEFGIRLAGQGEALKIFFN